MTTVLVAEDDPDIIAMISIKLTLAGHSVVTVADGESALDAARAGKVDLALLDVRMPGTCGVQVCQRLRSEPDTAQLPISLVTAAAADRDIEAGFAAGADDYLIKPFSPRELVNRVDAALARATASHAV